MKTITALILAVTLYGCSSPEPETGTVDFALTSSACSGRINLTFSRPAKDADLAIVGSWTCGSYDGPVAGTWSAGAESMALTLGTFPATARFGWTGLDGTAQIAGAAVPFHAAP